MNGTAEEQFRARARRVLEARESYFPRGAKNKAILEEVREEVELARKEVQAAAHAGQERVRRQTTKGNTELQRVIAQGKRELEKKADTVIEEKLDDAISKRFKGLALEARGDSSTASSAGEVGTTAMAVLSAPPPLESEEESEEEPVDLPPCDPEELEEWKREKEQERE